jgi:hypothetical protein
MSHQNGDERRVQLNGDRKEDAWERQRSDRATEKDTMLSNGIQQNNALQCNNSQQYTGTSLKNDRVIKRLQCTSTYKLTKHETFKLTVQTGKLQANNIDICSRWKNFKHIYRNDIYLRTTQLRCMALNSTWMERSGVTGPLYDGDTALWPNQTISNKPDLNTSTIK